MCENFEVSEGQIRGIISRLYGCSVYKIKPLDGYCDRNFYIETDSQADPDTTVKTRREYVLKIMNSIDTQNTALFELQTQVMQELNRNAIKCPKPVKNTNGAFYSVETLDTISEDLNRNVEPPSCHVVILLTYVQGIVLNEVNHVTSGLLHELGCLVARMNTIMEPFSENNIRPNAWQLDHFLKIIDYLPSIEDNPGHLRLITDIIERYKNEVLPNLRYLKKCLIHGDICETNILVATSNTDKDLEIAGILDFGDMHHGYRVLEVAVLIVTAIRASSTSHLDYLDAAASALVGFISQSSLSELELDLLHSVVSVRMATFLTSAEHMRLKNPENSYLTRAVDATWSIMYKIWNIRKDLFINSLQHRMSLIYSSTKQSLILGQNLVGKADIQYLGY